MYSNNDYRDYLEHSWGKKPEQKAREKEYNQSYYQTHKEKWKEYAKNAATGLANKISENSEEIGEKLADSLVDGMQVMQDVGNILGMDKAKAYYDAQSDYDRKLGDRRLYYIWAYQKDMKDYQNETDPFFKDAYKKWAKEDLNRAPSAGETRAAADRMRAAYNEFKNTPIGILDAAFEKASKRFDERTKERGW